MPEPHDIPGLPAGLGPTPGPQLAPSGLAQPCPQAFQVQVANAPNGASWVMVTFYGPCGSWSCFLDAAAAESLAAQIGESVTLARSGLVLARDPLPPSNGQRP